MKARHNTTLTIHLALTHLKEKEKEKSMRRLLLLQYIYIPPNDHFCCSSPTYMCEKPIRTLFRTWYIHTNLRTTGLHTQVLMNWNVLFVGHCLGSILG